MTPGRWALGDGKPSAASAEAGFSVIEVLVALGILALGVLALAQLQTANLRALREVETRVFASIVAENRLVETTRALSPPVPGEREGQVTLAGRDWTWRERVVPSPDPAIVRVSVEVEADGARVRVDAFDRALPR
jgi:general secretion pathway protein I